MRIHRRGKEAGRLQEAKNVGRRLAVAWSLALVTCASLAAPLSAASGPPIPGTSCGCFPSDNIWNTDIASLPVHPSSTDWVNNIGASKNLDLAFGPPNWGMPWI